MELKELGGMGCGGARDKDIERLNNKVMAKGGRNYK